MSRSLRPSFAADIEASAEGEPIEAVVIGAFGWGGWSEDPDDLAYGEESVPFIPWDRRGVVLPWEEARPLLDYQYDNGYGAPGCHAITAWTPSKVLFVTQYDGATGVDVMPRNPVDHRPEMPGG